MIKPLFVLTALLLGGALRPQPLFAANPIVPGVYTADPAAMVHGDTVYLYAGQDEAAPNTGYRMNRWLCYSSKDMKTWTSHGSPLAPRDFAWSTGEAWASQVIEKGGKFYYYVSLQHDDSKRGKAIGVAVSGNPTGPFKDARGSALVTAEMTSGGGHSWEDIDPTVFTDSDGTTYLFWGNRNCFYAKLKPNMTELDGPIKPLGVPWFTEAPWIHKRGNLYYLSYASGFPEKISYATALSINGPWTYRGILAEVAGNSNTIHQAIIDFKGQSYFIYHNGALPGGDSFRRSVCIDYLFYNSNGTMRRVVQTSEGTDLPPAPPTTPDVSLVPTWNRIQAFSNPDLFVRHANYKGVLAPSPVTPYTDSMWHVVPGLSDVRGVSFESIGLPGHFLRAKAANVVLEKDDGSAAFQQDATFLKEAALNGANGVSLRAPGEPKRYLRQSSGALRVEPISTPTDKAAATFRLLNEGGNANSLPAKNTRDAKHAPLTRTSLPTVAALGGTNPLVPRRADPQMSLQPDGMYYLTASVPEYHRIELRRAQFGWAFAPSRKSFGSGLLPGR